MSLVLVVLEKDGGHAIGAASRDALQAGADFAYRHKKDLIAFVLGNCTKDLSKDISSFGVHSIFFLPVDTYSQSLYIDTLASFIKDKSIDYVIAGASIYSYEYLPMLSARLNCSIATDVYSFDKDGLGESGLLVRRAYYTGKLIEELILLKEPIILSLASGVFVAKNKIDYEPRKIEAIAYKSGRERTDDIAFIARKLLYKVDVKGGDLMRASVIVSGGLGLGDAGNFALLEELASLLGASVGASRAVVELGWRSHSDQVGQTGKIVAPPLYIACGIRGAIQHIVGIMQSKYIIAINTDREAPIFRYADIGIVADVLEFLPALIEKLKEYKS